MTILDNLKAWLTTKPNLHETRQYAEPEPETTDEEKRRWVYTSLDSMLQHFPYALMCDLYPEVCKRFETIEGHKQLPILQYAQLDTDEGRMYFPPIGHNPNYKPL